MPSRSQPKARTAPGRPNGRRGSAALEERDQARLLPTADQARYGEEYRAELWEIAQAGDGRRAQLAYAARQVRSALYVRAELRSPRRRRAVP